MEEITLENLRPKFEKLVSELNELNTFCVENDISFSIDPKSRPNSSFSPSAYIYEWSGGFYLHKLKQTKIKEL